MGNNRVVADQSGIAIQKNHYYPFEMAFAEGATQEQGKQPYKYNGKELDRMHGLNLYDYSARYYDSAIGRFTTIDPLAEKYYSISPYAYCNNNPLRFIDPTGMAYSLSDPNQIGNMLDHLNNGGSVKDYDYEGWEETEEPEPPELSGTMCTYLGKIENLRPETFQGKSQQLPVSVGNYGGGVSWATDRYEAKLIGRSLSIVADSFDFSCKCWS